MRKSIDILGRKNKLIMMHRSADPDALGSAIALSRIFGGDIDITGGLNRSAKKMLGLFEMETAENPNFGDYNEIIVLDTASPAQLHTIPPEISLVIDHHLDAGEWEMAEHTLVDESAIACARIIKNIFETEGIDIDRDSALAMLFGMYTDSKGLSLATADFLRDFAELMDISGTDIGTINDILQDNGSDAVSTAVMKGLQRLKFGKYGKFTVAWTVVSVFESAVANALIHAGADIAFVGSEKDGDVRVIGRASERILRKGIHLGRFFSSLGYEMDGEGGGHDGAAGFTTVGDVEGILTICVSRFAKEIDK